jgi:putative membrane protein
MSKFIETWLLNGVSLWIIDHFTASISFADVMAIAFTALVLTILNSTIKPILKAVSFPLTFVTFGLFSLVINGAVLWAAFQLSEGSSIMSFGSAIWIALILAVLNSILDALFTK